MQLLVWNIYPQLSRQGPLPLPHLACCNKYYLFSYSMVSALVQATITLAQRHSLHLQFIVCGAATANSLKPFLAALDRRDKALRFACPADLSSRTPPSPSHTKLSNSEFQFLQSHVFPLQSHVFRPLPVCSLCKACCSHLHLLLIFQVSV